MARAYPEDPARDDVGGAVVLACDITVTGGVGPCNVLSEAPSGFGFGKAALSLGNYFRMKPLSESGSSWRVSSPYFPTPSRNGSAGA